MVPLPLKGGLFFAVALALACARVEPPVPVASALEGVDTRLVWRLDGVPREITFADTVVDVEKHPSQPLAFVYLGPERGFGRISATESILVDLESGAWRTLGTGPAPVGWPDDAWSPDGSRFVGLEDRFGPFLVIRSADASRWIAGEDGLAQRFAAKQFEAHQNHPAKVHRFERWIDVNAFEFTGTCCGEPIRYRVTVSESRVEPVSADY